MNKLIDLIIYTLVLMALVAGYMIYVSIASHKLVEERYKSQDQWIQKAIPEFQKLYQFQRRFRGSAQHKDCGEFLNQWVGWPGSAETPHGLTKFAPDQDAFKGLEAQLKDLGDHWAERFSEINLYGLDFSWMEELARCDDWDYEAASPVVAALRNNPFLSPDDYPVPDFEELEAWAQLRMIKGLKDNKFFPTLNDVSPLITALLRSENSKAVQAALHLFRREVEMVAEFRKRVNPEASGVFLSSYTGVNNVGQFIQDSKSFLNMTTQSKVIHDFFDQKPQSIFLCSVINAKVIDLIRDKILLGNDFVDTLSILDHLIMNGSPECRIRQARKLWKNLDYLPPDLRADNFVFPQTSILGLGLIYSATHSLFDNSGADNFQLPFLLKVWPAAARSAGAVIGPSSK